MAINAEEHVEVADRMSHNVDKGRDKVKRAGRNHAGAKELAGYYSNGECNHGAIFNNYGLGIKNLVAPWPSVTSVVFRSQKTRVGEFLSYIFGSSQVI